MFKPFMEEIFSVYQSQSVVSSVLCHADNNIPQLSPTNLDALLLICYFCTSQG